MPSVAIGDPSVEPPRIPPRDDSPGGLLSATGPARPERLASDRRDRPPGATFRSTRPRAPPRPVAVARPTELPRSASAPVFAMGPCHFAAPQRHQPWVESSQDRMSRNLTKPQNSAVQDEIILSICKCIEPPGSPVHCTPAAASSPSSVPQRSGHPAQHGHQLQHTVQDPLRSMRNPPYSRSTANARDRPSRRRPGRAAGTRSVHAADGTRRTCRSSPPRRGVCQPAARAVGLRLRAGFAPSGSLR